MKKTIHDIKSMPIWMLWKKRTRGQQTAKIPIAANGGPCGTSSNYASRWVTFDTAQRAVSEQNADGLGFRIPNGMFFLDIDHRDLQDPFVQEIPALYKSYSEYVGRKHRSFHFNFRNLSAEEFAAYVSAVEDWHLTGELNIDKYSGVPPYAPWERR